MATKGILLGQNNSKESLKKEIFFISDPITLNMDPLQSHSKSLFSELVLPIEKMKNYNYINLGIYDGSCSTKIAGYKSGQVWVDITFEFDNIGQFYIYHLFTTKGDTTEYKKSFTFSKNIHSTFFLSMSNQEYYIAPINNTKTYSLSSCSNCRFYTEARQINIDDYIDLNIRFYLEGIK